MYWHDVRHALKCICMYMYVCAWHTRAHAMNMNMHMTHDTHMQCACTCTRVRARALPMRMPCVRRLAAAFLQPPTWTPLATSLSALQCAYNRTQPHSRTTSLARLTHPGAPPLRASLLRLGRATHATHREQPRRAHLFGPQLPASQRACGMSTPATAARRSLACPGGARLARGCPPHSGRALLSHSPSPTASSPKERLAVRPSARARIAESELAPFRHPGDS